MPLVDVSLPVDEGPLPRDIRAFLREADRRIELFQRDRLVPAFVPSDFARAYAVLRAMAAGNVTAGNLFCEWGSGFGVVACLAAMLDFDAWGIEIEPELVDAARELAADFDLPVEFTCGSFIPPGGAERLSANHEFAWLTTDAASQEEPELEPSDFDVIFAYPWPDEEAVVETLFVRHAQTGAVLVTYHEGADFRLRRKRGRKFCRQRRR
jgi:hypothetical protein